MNELLKILNEIDDSIEWEKEQALIDEHMLDSFGVITLVSELEDVFSIELDASEIIPEHFNSVNAMWSMIKRLQEA